MSGKVFQQNQMCRSDPSDVGKRAFQGILMVGSSQASDCGTAPTNERGQKRSRRVANALPRWAAGKPDFTLPKLCGDLLVILLCWGPSRLAAGDATNKWVAVLPPHCSEVDTDSARWSATVYNLVEMDLKTARGIRVLPASSIRFGLRNINRDEDSALNPEKSF